MFETTSCELNFEAGNLFTVNLALENIITFQHNEHK